MSAPRRQLVLLPQAWEDVGGALIHTRQQWGVEQRSRYRALLYDVMRGLIDLPERGRTRNELFPGCRSHPAGQHVLYYHVTDAQIIVVRVLHARQDAGSEVSEPAP